MTELGVRPSVVALESSPSPVGSPKPSTAGAEQSKPTPTLAEQLVPAPSPTETATYTRVDESGEDPAITLGSWPDWIAAIGTSLALIIAAVTYFRSVRGSTQAQARLVYARITELEGHSPGAALPTRVGATVEISVGEGRAIVPGRAAVATAGIMRAVVRIHNGSDELMGPAKVQLWDTGLNKPMERVTLEAGQIEPGGDFFGEMTVINEHHPNQPGVGLVLVYRDSSRRWWKRHGVEPIERIHADPHTMAETADQREARAKLVRSLFGGDIEPLPRITPAVHWHRFWRRVRRKPPVP